jgi:2-polyprenyl-6-methoxyphenol hydroxylase-like FAD-dependent oxidoreductase
MSQQPPTQAKVVIVGAGPSGLTTAVSLIKHGIPVQDIVIVDSVLSGENTSRAVVLHAATLEVRFYVFFRFRQLNDKLSLGAPIYRMR